MKINWFPGHMNKALRDIEQQCKNVDVVVYVLDARIPLSSLNPSLDRLTQNKPVLYVLNKFDLTDEARFSKIIRNFVGESKDYLCFNSTKLGKKSVVIEKIRRLAHVKIEKYESRGVKATIKVMVVGIPNSGKSTFVNNLAGKAKTVTGDRAGVTKRGQWLPLGDGVEIYDTPGTLYPNIEDQKVALKLAFVGSVRDEILIFEEIGRELLALLIEKYPDAVEKRYPGAKSLEDVAVARGFKLGKDELDLERAGRAVVEDFRKGRMGRLMLD